MIIKKIEIDGFGIYNDFILDDLTRGVNIIRGDNEAGKTTLLKFLRYTLFGYPRQIESRMAPLKGGVHGGRITGILSTGSDITIERRGNNSLKVWTDGELTESGDMLSKILGNASASLYNKVYAITVDELGGLAELSDSGVDERIFSVGMGLGKVSLAEVENDLKRETGEIYKPAGRNQLVPEILRLLQENQKIVYRKQTLISERARISDELDKVRAEAAKLREIADAESDRRFRLESLLKCHDDAVIVYDTEKEIRQLDEPGELPEKGVQRLEVLEDKLASLEESLARLRLGWTDAPGIAELEGEIEEITYNKILLDKKAGVEYLVNNTEKYRDSIMAFSRASEEIKGLEQKLLVIKNGIAPGLTEDEILGFNTAERYRLCVAAFRNKMAELKERRIGLQSQADAFRQRGGVLNAYAIAIVISVVLSMFSLVMAYYKMYIPASALILSALLVFLFRKRFTNELPLQSLLKELEELGTKETETWREFTEMVATIPGIQTSAGADEVEALISDLEKMSDLMGRKNTIVENLEQNRVPFISQFEGVVSELAPVADIDPDQGNPELIAGMIILEYRTSEKSFNRREATTTELNRLKREESLLEQRIEEVRSGIRMLLGAAGASDREEFFRKYNLKDKITRLTDIRDNAMRNIENIAGLGKHAEVIDYLKANGKDKLVSEISGLKISIASHEENIRGLDRRTGELMTRKEQVEEESGMAEILSAMETDKTRLQTGVKDWLAGRIALELLGEVKARYERDMQPAVISRAGRYFSGVTGGLYTRLHVSMGDREVRVYDDSGRFKTTAQLSRGAKEQLLICLRLGFIGEYEKLSEPLPVIADEVLVNFDKIRASRMAGALSEFSEGRQLIIFTCHNSTAELFKGDDTNIIGLGSNQIYTGKT